MQTRHLAGALTLLAVPSVAQTPVNAFHVYNDRTSFTSRAFLGVNGGETLQGFPAAQIRGVGDTGAAPKLCLVHAFGMLTQDQDQQTKEQYRVVFRREYMGMPDGSPAGILFQTGKLDLPTGAGTGPAAWNITVNFGDDGVAIPCNATFFAGLALDPNAKWTADGQSTWASAYTDPASASGDPVRKDAPNNAWQVDDKGVATQANPRTWSYRLHTRRGAFQIGSRIGTENGLYGSSGLYPDALVHGLAFRIRDAAMKEMPAAIFLSDSLIGGAPLPFDGLLWINPGTLILVAQGVLSATGEIEFLPDAFAPGKLKDFLGLGDLPFQGVILDVGNQRRLNLRMTNAQATNL